MKMRGLFFMSVSIDQIVLWLLACCALLGGADRLLGNRLGLGEKFEEGFHLLGSTALSMAGILCLTPLFSELLCGVISRLCTPLGLDPAMLGGLLAVDMGGYQLAQDLAADPHTGNFAGVCVSAILGCTLTFTIPVGMGMLKGDERTDFAWGILFGLLSVPAALVVGGYICGLSFASILWQSLPILFLCALILLGLRKKTVLTLHIFSGVSRCISLVATLGAMFGAFESLTGVALIPHLAPIEDSMAVVSSIGVALLGSLPMTRLLEIALKRPLQWLSKKTGMNGVSVTSLLVGMVSVLPAVARIKDMDRRGRIVNAAFIVCAASALAAHLGFVASVDKGMLGALLLSKFTGGILGASIAIFATRSSAKQ